MLASVCAIKLAASQRIAWSAQGDDARVGAGYHPRPLRLPADDMHVAPEAVILDSFSVRTATQSLRLQPTLKAILSGRIQHFGCRRSVDSASYSGREAVDGVSRTASGPTTAVPPTAAFRASAHRRAGHCHLVEHREYCLQWSPTATAAFPALAADRRIRVMGRKLPVTDEN